MIMTDVSSSSGIDWSILWTRFNWLDGVLVLLFAVGIVVGLKKGLTKMFSGLIAVLIAQTIAVEYYRPLSRLTGQMAPVTPEVLEGALFGVLGFACLIFVIIIAKILSNIVTLDFKGSFNTIGGALAGAFQFVLFLGLVVSFLNLLPLPSLQKTFRDYSITGTYLMNSSSQVHDTAILLVPEGWRMK